MKASEVKFLVVVAIALAMWRLFEVDGVSTAFWSLITVGAIPGSNRELGTETMLRILCVVFGIAVFIIFRKEFFAALPHRHPKSKVAMAASGTIATAAAIAAESVETAQPVRPAPSEAPADDIIVTLSRQPQRRWGVARPLVHALCIAVIAILQAKTWLEARCVMAWQWLVPRVWMVAITSWRALCRAGRFVYRHSRVAVHLAVKGLVAAWKYAEPHFRMFDQWLEKQLRANPYSRDALHFMSDFSKAASGTYQKAQDARRKLLEDK
jgi:hypothetical protein